PDVGALAQELHRKPHGIARHHRTAEAGLVDGHEVDELAAPGGAAVMNDQAAGGLGHGLDHQDAGHHRVAGKVPGEERLVYGDVLDADGRNVGIHLDDPVDHQERITVRQKFHYPGNVGCPELPCMHEFSHFAWFRSTFLRASTSV